MLAGGFLDIKNLCTESHQSVCYKARGKEANVPPSKGVSNVKDAHSMTDKSKAPAGQAAVARFLREDSRRTVDR